MEKSITRRITTYDYPVSRIVMDENGTPTFEPLAPLTSFEPLNSKKLLKKGEAVYPGEQLFFGAAQSESQLYTMSLRAFMENATLKEDN